MTSESNTENTENTPNKKFKPQFNLKKINFLFLGIVVLPTVLSAIYFGAIAADRYVSESSFVVRSANNQSNVSNLGALFQNVGISRSQDDIYTVQEYMRSRSALGELSKQMPVRSFYEIRWRYIHPIQWLWIGKTGFRRSVLSILQPQSEH